MFEPVSVPYTMNYRGKIIPLNTPWVMGILNVTEDSFYDGGLYKQRDSALARVHKMISEGVDIIDIGGMSSRPGASISLPQQEADVVIPVVEALISEFPDIIISIDTLHAYVAENALKAGAGIINDISAGRFDYRMLEVVSRNNAVFIAMHMQGLPRNMQQTPVYDNVITTVLDFFIERIEVCRKAGIADMIIDPGFGFGKTNEHNFSVLKHFATFSELGLPVLAGISRKSMIWRSLQSSPAEALNGTSALNMMALQAGAKILRVHDVKEAKECIKLHQQLINAQ